MSYVSIHNHDMYSTLDGFSTPKEMLDKAQEIGLKGYCITNHGNAFSLPYYEKIKANYPDLKVIYGVELYECLDKNIKDNDNRYYHLVALARNEKGRIAINKLITKSNFEGFYYKPRIEIADIKEYANDLIISSACLASKLSREQDYSKCIEYIKEYKSIFPNFYLEMQSHNDPDQHEYNNKILKLSKDTNTKFVITTDSHFANKDDLQYQQQFVSIAKDSETMSEGYAGCYLQTEEEIHEILDEKIGKENVNLGLLNTLDILNLVGDVKIPFQEPKLPHFEIPSEYKDMKEYILYLAEEGWKRKIDLKKCDEKTYRERFDYEISVIFQMGFEGYFLILWDILKWARDNNIAVGAGRGSAAGSLVSYLLDITDLDPIKYKLIFERFLNPERISMPDIDVDVSDRQSVLNYLESKYGVDKVCQVANFSTITPKVAVSDAARIINSREKVNKIPTSTIQNFANIFSRAEEFDDVIENNKLDIDNYCRLDSRFIEVIEIAKKFSGKVRQLSIHACAVGIVDGEITDYMPMHNGGKGEKVIQADKRIVEDIGIVKFDLLGISTLDVLQKALDYLSKDFSYISPNNNEMLDDKQIYKTITVGNTEAIFQLESYGMKDVCKKLKPENIEDISAILALYRPDTMQLMDDYIERKHGRQEITYIHPDMQPILKETFGAMIYQEQLLDIVRKFGGRTYGGADKFRKGIGRFCPVI